jgi:hypothetical protein
MPKFIIFVNHVPELVEAPDFHHAMQMAMAWAAEENYSKHDLCDICFAEPYTLERAIECGLEPEPTTLITL